MRQKFTTADLEWHARKLAKLAGLDPDGQRAGVAQDAAPSMTVPDPQFASSNWEVFALEAVPSLTDEQLIDLWEGVPDPEHLAPIPQAVMNEMAQRELDF